MIYSSRTFCQFRCKTEYQNAEKVKSDSVINEEVAEKLSPDYDPPCSQLTYEADIRNANERILERKNSLFKIGLERSLNVWIIISCILLFTNLLEQAHVLEMNSVTSRGSLATRKLLKNWVPTWFLYRENQLTK